MIYVNVLYLILTMISCFERPDFLNLTVSGMAILIVTNSFSRVMFRVLVMGLVVSSVYDVVWLYNLYTEFNEDTLEVDSKLERNMKQMALTTSMLSLALRPLVIAVYWRASVDHRSIVKLGR